MSDKDLIALEKSLEKIQREANLRDSSFDAIFDKKPWARNELKRLKPIHKHIIAYHLRGASNKQIAATLNITEQTVSNTINDPLALELINQFGRGVEKEMHALFPLAVDAIRNGLNSYDRELALKAVDRLFKATGRFESHKEEKETAEDVIARALARVSEDNAATLRNISEGTSKRRNIQSAIGMNTEETDG